MHLALVTEKFSEQISKQPPPKHKYADDRRTYLTKAEVQKLADAARKTGRHGERDALMIMTAYRHGLRATELVNLRLAQINLQENSISVKRAKRGKDNVHPFVNRQERKDWLSWVKRNNTEFVFEGERGPLTTRAFFKVVSRAGKEAGFQFEVTPHMLRHAAGYELTNNGMGLRLVQDFLGHKAISSTCRYTALAPNAFAAMKDIL